MSRLRVNTLTNKTDDGAPVFTHGASVVGVVTATSFEGSFKGDGSQLTGVTAPPASLGILDSGVSSGTASSLNIGDNLVVEYIDAGGVATVNADFSSITNSFVTSTTLDTRLADLVDSAPGTLDTLNELAAALGDDPNFSTTITNSIASKANLSGADFTGNVSVTGTITADAYSFANLAELP